MQWIFICVFQPKPNQAVLIFKYYRTVIENKVKGTGITHNFNPLEQKSLSHWNFV